MEGYIVNNCGKPKYIFKRNFPVGHRLYLAELWKMYEVKVKKALEKDEVSEADFLAWLTANHYMKPGFAYYPGEKASLAGDVVEATGSGVKEEGSAENGRLVKPSLANVPSGVLEKLTYSEIANLRILDNPKKVVEAISNLHKLRRAYTVVRQMPRKGHLQKILRDRIQDLESV